MHDPLLSKVRRGFRGFPVATISYYGPDSRRATKVAVRIVGAPPASRASASWSIEHGDVRNHRRTWDALAEFVQASGVASVWITAGVVGCPHEDQAEAWAGETCPHCAFWAARNRRPRRRELSA